MEGADLKPLPDFSGPGLTRFSFALTASAATFHEPLRLRLFRFGAKQVLYLGLNPRQTNARDFQGFSKS